MDSTNVIIKPLVTEKATRLQEQGNSYVFKVANDANKYQIKQAVESLYSVKVTSVRTINRAGKPRRSKTRVVTTSDWKRAIVTLHEDSRIELF
ncbi:MAG: 50S ribosomal protein L23 [Phycisphaerales bacterium]|nr:50S ribosomal protein L23 [Phycisphaerales bacterium]